MTPVRKKRLFTFLFVITGVAIALFFVLRAAGENLNHFYEIDDITNGKAPMHKQIRIGGMIKNGSIKRKEDSLDVDFTITDYNNDVVISYSGILPDLFKEGQGVMLTGEMIGQNKFKASEVLAKHDENYMPPEVMKQLEGHQTGDSQ